MTSVPVPPGTYGAPVAAQGLFVDAAASSAEPFRLSTALAIQVGI